MKKYTATLSVTGLLLASFMSYAEQPKNLDEIEPLVQFLLSDKILVNNENTRTVPLSYYVGTAQDVAKYFGDYICSPTNTCAVVDSLYSNPYAILGRGVPPQKGTLLDVQSAQAQLERTDVKYGADIYDAATWQIALALAAKQGVLDHDEAQMLVDNQLQRIMKPQNRAVTNSFQYGYSQSISTSKNAFTYRMLAPDFHNKDPFYQTSYQHNVSWDYDPEILAKYDPDKHPADFFKFTTTWSDWKPITGENAWAQLIGPLQAEYILSNGKFSVDSVALNNAIDSLYAFSAMQAGVGAFYYAPGGSLGNEGPIPKGEISIENNFSALAGLQILKQVLLATEQTPRVTTALASIDIMLNGGKTVNGYTTRGLLSFIYNGAYDAEKGIFFTHGLASDPTSQNGWVPDTSTAPGAMAVDISTWGIASLGAANIDKWYGKGTALKIWQNVRDKGGYYNNGQLWGVGYTMNNRAENIMSTEWTAGAINAVKVLIAYYSQENTDPTILKSLHTDLESMENGIKNLRNDLYLKANFTQATPAKYFVQVPKCEGQAYLYASKRFAIPFGWFANTLPSTTSNAWVIMNKLQFNPFQYGGKFSGEDYPVPLKL